MHTTLFTPVKGTFFVMIGGLLFLAVIVAAARSLIINNGSGSDRSA